MMFDLFFSPWGRLEREPYALACLFWMLIECAVIAGVLGVEKGTSAEAFWGITLLLAGAASTISVVLLTMKRARAFGWPPHVAAATLIPGIGLGLVILLMVTRAPDER